MSARLALDVSKKFDVKKVDWRDGVTTEKMIIWVKPEIVEDLLKFLEEHGYELARFVYEREKVCVELIKEKD